MMDWKRMRLTRENASSSMYQDIDHRHQREKTNGSREDLEDWYWHCKTPEQLIMCLRLKDAVIYRSTTLVSCLGFHDLTSFYIDQRKPLSSSIAHACLHCNDL